MHLRFRRWRPHLHNHWTHWQVRVTYLEGNEDDETALPTGEKSVYTGQVVNCDLEKMLIHVRWPGGEGDDWVSLLEDDWEWVDGGRPTKDELAAALKRRKPKKDSHLPPPEPAAAVTPPRPPPPPPPKAVDLKVDSTERSQHLAAAVKTLGGMSPQLAANIVRKCSGYGVHEIILLIEMGALKPLVKLLTHSDERVQQDAGVALVNISLYEPARAALLKQNIVAALSELLQGNDVQQEVGLALLQNISLYAGSHAEL